MFVIKRQQLQDASQIQAQEQAALVRPSRLLGAMMFDGVLEGAEFEGQGALLANGQQRRQKFDA